MQRDVPDWVLEQKKGVTGNIGGVRVGLVVVSSHALMALWLGKMLA